MASVFGHGLIVLSIVGDRAKSWESCGAWARSHLMRVGRSLRWKELRRAIAKCSIGVLLFCGDLS
ncbi:MAG: hypothetical protein HC849_08030 [Oscillatoriales cyanobacterium RU_3_3]|nr:hypothetical protein [Oscillatoriales cyanobacterium RU_3_3]NJR21964.1 hypothetical protein [Richelia sp. CSU_2_1]